jgi:hypothetical protein
MQQNPQVQYAERVDGKNLEGRVAQVTSILVEAGYMAEQKFLRTHPTQLLRPGGRKHLSRGLRL